MGATGFTGAPGEPAVGGGAIIPYAMGMVPENFPDYELPFFIGFGAHSFFNYSLNWVAPRAGTLQNFVLAVGLNNANYDTVFTIEIAGPIPAPFAPTILALLVPAGTTGNFDTGLASTAILKGTRVLLRAEALNPPEDQSGTVVVTGGLEFV